MPLVKIWKSALMGVLIISTYGLQERWLDAEAEKARPLPGTSSAHHTADSKAGSPR